MIRWASPIDEPHHSKLDDAIDRGYVPHRDDLLPPPAHLLPPAGVNPFAWFVHETRAMRIVGPLTRCAHPHCRTRVTEDDVSWCPHSLPFCEGCAWADSCDDCANTQPHYDGAS